MLPPPPPPRTALLHSSVYDINWVISHLIDVDISSRLPSLDNESEGSITRAHGDKGALQDDRGIRGASGSSPSRVVHCQAAIVFPIFRVMVRVRFSQWEKLLNGMYRHSKGANYRWLNVGQLPAAVAQHLPNDTSASTASLPYSLTIYEQYGVFNHLSSRVCSIILLSMCEWMNKWMGIDKWRNK